MHGFLSVILVLLLLGVLGVLGAGMVGIARGGTNPRRSNQLMRWRVILQAAALVVLVLLMALMRG